MVNWKIEPGMDMGGGNMYFMIEAGDQSVGGLMKSPPESKDRSFWLSCVSVRDADEAAAAAAKNGGMVLTPTMTMPNVGRYAVIADADGAALSIMKTPPEMPDQPISFPPKASEFCWETLSTTDESRAKAFYGAVLGWKTMKGPDGKESVFTVDGSREAQVADLQKAQGMPANWLTYMVVEKLEPTRDRVAKLGGKVMMPLVEVPKVGRIAVISDPTGGVIGLFEPGRG